MTTTPSVDPATIFVQAAPRDAASWTALARRVEQLGLGGLYVADHPGTAPSPFVALAAAAAVTDRITLGTCVVNAGLWHPIDLAAAVATLDLVSDGRALLGIGAGHTPQEWTVRGRPAPNGSARIARLAEVVDAARALLRGDLVTSHGEHVTLEGASLAAPLPPGHDVPLMIGGNGPQLLELAAREADVVGITGLGRTLPDGHRHMVEWSPDAVTDTIERVRRVARDGGKHPQVEALVQRIEITDDAAGFAATMAAAIDGAEPADVLAAPYVWVGSVDEIRAELDRHRDAGIDRWVVRDSALDAVAAIVGRD